MSEGGTLACHLPRLIAPSNPVTSYGEIIAGAKKNNKFPGLCVGVRASVRERVIQCQCVAPLFLRGR